MLTRLIAAHHAKVGRLGPQPGGEHGHIDRVAAGEHEPQSPIAIDDVVAGTQKTHQ